MSTATAQPLAAKRILLPKAPVLVCDGSGFVCLTTDGEIQTMTHDDVRQMLRDTAPIVCNAPYVAKLAKVEKFAAYDVLELFAFIHPGQFAVPTPRGLARMLNLLEPASAEDQCLSLRDVARHLLTDLSAPGRQEKTNPAGIAVMMGLMHTGGGGWPWMDSVLAALGRSDTPPTQGEMKASLRIWDNLPEWSIHAPDANPSQFPVSEEAAAERLHKMLARQKKEDRPEQQAFTKALTHAFAPQDEDGETKTVMAEAGTGTGKTLGYLAPATIWAEENGGAVWISTYTRNLQRQVDAELEKLYDDPVTKARKVVVRKGRENYLCVLNLEDAAQSAGVLASDINAVALGLMTRWAAITETGDLAGKDFPGWLAGLLGWNRVYNFADRRGECIYSACPHFNKCFIEKSIRKAKRADIVIANHALVMNQTYVAGADDVLPSRYVFDEGHHIFEAADNAFDLQLNGTETADLRRWILGTEAGGKKSRARGLKRRLEDLIVDDADAQKDLERVLEAAKTLPAPQWRQRLSENAPKGFAETFLLHCLKQVHARNKDPHAYYSLETETQPAIPGLLDAAHDFYMRLGDLVKPMNALVKRLKDKLVDEADTLNADMKERIRFAAGSLQRRSTPLVGGWMEMLKSLGAPPPPEAVDWLEVTRVDGKDYDVGFYRYYVDPAKVFAETLKPHAAGVIMTSATFRDTSDEDPQGWKSPAARTGLNVFTPDPHLFHTPSPFNYAAQTKVLVVKDIDKNTVEEVAAAYRALFIAAGGGALGIFTAVTRLRAVESRLRTPLEKAGIHLYAQHVDPLDTGTLIDIFREEENACLLGTDATRDGIDVPGRSLRLVVYDRVPWPKPTILHKARRAHFGKNYDDMLTRFKLKQAYGRLVRRHDDKGIFVMMDGALPTRLTTAFPEGVEVQRVGLAEAVEIIKTFNT